MTQEMRHEIALRTGGIRISGGAIGDGRLVRLCVDRKHGSGVCDVLT